jgi:hypothetical protein
MAASTAKTCAACHVDKPLDEFYDHKSWSDGKYPYCAHCSRLGMRGHKHGTTRDHLLAMMERQGGRCAICLCDISAWGRDVHIDHDHACCPTAGSCGECIRGLLCRKCNYIVGHSGDNPQLLVAAAEYLHERSL